MLRQLLFTLFVGFICCTGCGKKSAGASSAPYDVAGVKVDYPKLQADLTGAAPEAQALVADLGSNLRYGFYDKALQSLDKLSSSPGLTDAQKQSVNAVIEQMKQVIAKAGASR